MRLFAIGDIHGCATALDTLLMALNLQPPDRLIALGDYINKGPDAKAVLDRLIQLWGRGMVMPLLGNHELQMLKAGRLQTPRTDHEVLIDQPTLSSYAAGDSSGDDRPGLSAPLGCIPQAHWQFVRQHCLHWVETAGHMFVHANLQPNQPLASQPDHALFFDKFYAPRPHCSGKTMVCGHTPQRSGFPANLGYAICLDTAACEGQWLTCLEVGSGEVWQANQQQELRKSHIEDYR